ncbi:MAG: ATP-binding protein [Myxococcota bacterium]|nr:ATP-binding protein [Myxococcota bacterium]
MTTSSQVTRSAQALALPFMNPAQHPTLFDAHFVHQAKLEEQLRLRTAEAHEARAALLRQERVASMGKLAASIAHEVNNPISFMLSNLHQATKDVSELKRVLQRLLVLADFAVRQPESDHPAIESGRRMAEQAIEGRTVDTILAEVRDLEEIVAESMDGAEQIRRVSDDMRRFAHGLPGRMDWADVEAIVESALHVIDDGSRNGVRFVRRSEPLASIPAVRCQRHQIAQVLLNLLQNAAEAVAETGTIEVRTRSAGSWVEIEIANDGPGLTSEDRERIFEAFYTTKSEGTGLGLAISRDIAEAHGGSLAAVEARSGACFLLRLPVETA